MNWAVAWRQFGKGAILKEQACFDWLLFLFPLRTSMHQTTDMYISTGVCYWLKQLKNQKNYTFFCCSVQWFHGVFVSYKKTLNGIMIIQRIFFFSIWTIFSGTWYELSKFITSMSTMPTPQCLWYPISRQEFQTLSISLHRKKN